MKQLEKQILLDNLDARIKEIRKVMRSIKEEDSQEMLEAHFDDLASKANNLYDYAAKIQARMQKQG